MLCVLVTNTGSFDLVQREPRKPEPDEAMVRVSVTGVCRTDLKLIRNGHRDLILPCIPGEEVVGRVIQTGTQVTNFAPGDRVYIYPGQWCGKCHCCRNGAMNLCGDMRIMGFHRPGGFAEFVTVPAQSLIHIPESLPDDEAIFAEPLSCCLNALQLARLRPGESIGVWGAGPAGTLLVRAAAALGAKPFSVEPDPRRRELLATPLLSPGQKVHVCVVATGSTEAYREAIQSLLPRGRLVLFSGLPPAETRLPVDFNELHYREQTLVGAYGCAYQHGEQALRLLADKSIAIRDMVSHRMPLTGLARALDIVEQRAGMKILLYPNGDHDAGNG